MTNINTVDYWNSRFSKNGSWVALNGLAQSQNFMECIIENLPEGIKSNLNGKTICDLGSGIATGTKVLKENFPDSKVIGVDFSTVALEVNQDMFPDIEFYLDLNKRTYAIFNSNVLEHVDEPLTYLQNYLKLAIKYFIILVPYKEQLGDIPEHIHSFSEQSFPDELNGFKKIMQKTIKTKYWMWDQALVIFERVGKNKEK